MMKIKLNSIDLFAGCGGLTEGMHQAGFSTAAAVELVNDAARTFSLNHKTTEVIQKDIRLVKSNDLKNILNGETLHLLAGCPPCQGFSSLRRLNRKKSVQDKRNALIEEYFRIVKELRPLTIMMENVPGLQDYYLFKNIVSSLNDLGYRTTVKVLNVKDYGVPQNRKRLIMVGSLLGDIDVAPPVLKECHVRDAIFKLPLPKDSKDPLHQITANHSEAIQKRIALTPKNGGSWKDLPDKYILKCHKNKKAGFNDVYGRLRWDSFSSTITGGCLNPSKGRFLHPQQNRVISPREAALLQSFPSKYKFPLDISKSALALMIGNALPPKFSYYQSLNLANHIKSHLNIGKVSGF